jgi:REP element-mobilizing transposase RayT
MHHQRKSPRWKEYDYTSPWWYFVTICTKDRECYFGTIHDGEMIVSAIGKICEQELEIMIDKRPSVDMHAYVIMPNHIHLLFFVNECRDTGLPCPINKDDASIRPYTSWIATNQSLWSIIWWLKSAVTRQCNLKWLSFVRQSRYHDHIIRNEDEYNHIKYYIQTNPQNREIDSLQS